MPVRVSFVFVFLVWFSLVPEGSCVRCCGVEGCGRGLGCGRGTVRE